MENPYRWSNDVLVKEFMNACAKAGVEGSGLIISIGGPDHHARAHYLKGVVLARLDGYQPPFNPGDVVRSRGEYDVRSVDYWGSQISADAKLEVSRVLYVGQGKWYLVFKEVHSTGGYSDKRQPYYDSSHFTLFASNASVDALIKS